MSNIVDVLELQDKFTAQFNKFSSLAKSASSSMGAIEVSAEGVITKVEMLPDGQEKYNKKVREGQAEADKLMSIVKGAVVALGGIAAVSAMTQLSDSLNSIEARINAINDSTMSTAGVMDMMFNSAQRTGTAYIDMADTVAKLHAQTDGVFANIQETTRFAELLNEQFIASGTDANAISSVMYNLTQAMSSGVLRGQDFNIILQNSSALIKRIADHMGVSVGEMRKLAEQGAITGDIIKSAIMESADDIDKSFENMPMTFGRATQQVRNQAVKAFQPIAQNLARMMSSEDFTNGLNRAIVAIGILVNVAGKGFGFISRMAEFTATHWDILAPIIFTVATAIGVYAIATGTATAATAAWNAILEANPIILIVTFIAVLIVSIYMLIDAFAQMAGGAQTGFGVITGGVMVVIEFFRNLGLAVANITLGIGAATGALGGNIVTAFGNSISTVQGFFWGLLSTATEVIAGIAEMLSRLPFVEFDYEGLNASAQNFANKSAEAYGNVQEYTDVGEAFKEASKTFNAFSEGWVGDAYNKGAAWGDGVANGISNGIDGLFGGGAETNDWQSILGGSTAGGDGMKVDGGKLDSVGSIGEVKLSDEDLKLYRDLAERAYMNNINLTTQSPNISVSVTNPNGEPISAEEVAEEIRAMLVDDFNAGTSVSHAF